VRRMADVEDSPTVKMPPTLEEAAVAAAGLGVPVTKSMRSYAQELRCAAGFAPQMMLLSLSMNPLCRRNSSKPCLATLPACSVYLSDVSSVPGQVQMAMPAAGDCNGLLEESLSTFGNGKIFSRSAVWTSVLKPLGCPSYLTSLHPRIFAPQAHHNHLSRVGDESQ
jgi:hypothetical protein